MVEVSKYWFSLQCVLKLSSLDSFLEQLRAGLGDHVWPQVQGFASPTPSTAKLKPASEPDLRALLATLSKRVKTPASVTIGFGELSALTWGQRPDGATLHLRLGLSPSDNVFTDPAECVRAPTRLLKTFLELGNVETAVVERLGDATACVPLVPLAKTRRPLLLTTEAEVAENYEREDDFWSAGWHIAQFGAQRLLTRCQDVVSKGEVLREIRDYQWQMARAAKPTRTKYGFPTIEPDEKPVYEEGEARLYPVGRDKTTGLVEYSCVLEHGEHLHGWEIFYLWSLLQNKKMQDGTLVSAVRVVFTEPWMAESEKRPLLDIGVRVMYEDATTGELVNVDT